jgi:DNA polymerase-1
MINVYNNIVKHKYDAKIILQIHDEILIEANENIAEELAIELKKVMEVPIIKDLKLVANYNIGTDWYSAHD